MTQNDFKTMKRNTRYSILSFAATIAVVALVGCQRDDLAVDTAADGILNFSIGFAGSGEIALSKGATLTSEDGSVSIPLSCAVTDGIEVDIPGAAGVTKGTQINSESEFLGEGLTSFTAAGWRADKREFVPTTGISYSDGKWQTAATYYWRGSDDKTFLAYANLPSSGATVINYVDPAVKQTFTYTVPTDAREQNDIMLGWYEGNGGGTATAAITMVHPLTAVVFKKGDMDASVSAIKNISIAGVYIDGTADVTYSLSGSDVVPACNWSDSRTGSQTVTLSPAEGATELEVAADGKIGTSFIVLPQTIGEGALTVNITIVKDGTDAVLSATVPAGQWQEGKTNTYTLDYTGNVDPNLLPGKFSISATEYVQFSRGNLFCTSSGSGGSSTYKFDFEKNQYDYRCRSGKSKDKAVIGGTETTTPSSTSGLFQWIERNSTRAGDDWGAFATFTDGDSNDEYGDELDFGGVFPDDDWITLTGNQWTYLLGQHKNRFVTVIGVNGLAIAPDDYEGEISASYTTLEQWTAAEADGIVFLPIYGYYNAQMNYVETTESCYWSSSPNSASVHYATALHFAGTISYVVNERWRIYGQNVRLVQKFDWPKPSYGLTGQTYNDGGTL